MQIKAETGLMLLKSAILDFLEVHPGSLNSEIARGLNLESSHNGNQQDYLTYSILGELMKEGKIIKDNKKYYLK